MTLSLTRPWRTRMVAVAVAPVLALGTLAAAPAASYADVDVDPIPAERAGDWLASRLVDGAIPDTYFADSVDVGMALLAVGGHADQVNAISDYLAAKIDTYVAPYGGYEPGEAARAAVFVHATGGDITRFGGRDLLRDVEGGVTSSGRLVGTLAGHANSNNTDQAFGVLALNLAGSSSAAPATDFMLGQQCADGSWLRGDGGGSSNDYSPCPTGPWAGFGPRGNSAVTALSALALLPRVDDPAHRAAVDRAVAWLLDAQATDGSFPTEWDAMSRTRTDPDIYSTGLAAQALGAVGKRMAARDAAGWLRSQQVEPAPPCAAGPVDAVGSFDQSAWHHGEQAVAAALLGLLQAPSGAGDLVVTPPSEYVRAGARHHVVTLGAAPGQAVCFAGGSSQGIARADVAGRTVGSVMLPEGTGRRTFTVTASDGAVGTVALDALAATTLDLTVRSAFVKPGRRQRVAVRGLAVGESLRIKYQGEVIERGTAGFNGRFVASFPVGTTPRQRTVRVLGEFGNRRGLQRFVVGAGR